MTAPNSDSRASILTELKSARAAFHALLDSLSDEDLRRRSLNPGWTNGEILFHMTFGFMLIPPLVPMLRLFGRLPKRFSRAFAWLLNAGTPLFNWVNALGARGGGKVYDRPAIARKYDRVHASILRIVDSIKDDEWQCGMYYPHKWDHLFDEYMTLEQVLRYPTIHLRFHLDQIAR